MSLRWIIATLHLLALPIGFAAIVARGRGLRRLVDDGAMRRVLAADNWWGLAAILWITTGPWRAFGELEKGTAYYVSHPLFHAKLGLFGLIFALELWPMINLVRWRLALRRGQRPDTTRAAAFATISTVQAGLVVVIVVLATALARGLGLP
jgi:putative membrane protein